MSQDLGERESVSKQRRLVGRRKKWDTVAANEACLSKDLSCLIHRAFKTAQLSDAHSKSQEDKGRWIRSLIGCRGFNINN